MIFKRRKVLVLNKSWYPIAIVSLKKAIGKLFDVYVDGTPKAKIIDHLNNFEVLDWHDWAEMEPNENEPMIISPKKNYRCPEVIQYTKYDKMPSQRRNFSKSTLYKRDNHTCQYCGTKKSMQNLSIDHIVPRSQGGITTWDNVVIACKECNAKKADRTPDQANMPLLKKPLKPSYTLIYEDDSILKSWEQFIK